MMPAMVSLDCSSFGVPFRLAADSNAVLAKMRKHAPFATVAAPSPYEGAQQFKLLSSTEGEGYRLFSNGEAVAEGLEIRRALDDFARELMVHVAGRAPDRVFVHAGVVGWRGRALVLPGPSFAGKTTLVAELVRAGADYYSDEYAVLDDSGKVYPFARELKMRAPGRKRQRLINVNALKGGVGVAPLSISHIVFTQYVEGGEWKPKPLSAGLAALEMMRHAIPVRRTPARVMAALAKAMEHAAAVRSQRGEASELARVLLETMNDLGQSE